MPRFPVVFSAIAAPVCMNVDPVCQRPLLETGFSLRFRVRAVTPPSITIVVSIQHNDCIQSSTSSVATFTRVRIRCVFSEIRDCIVLVAD